MNYDYFILILQIILKNDCNLNVFSFSIQVDMILP